MVSVAPPLLVSVTVFAALVVPNNWLPKLRLVAERVTFGGGEPVLTAASALKMATTNGTRMPARRRHWFCRRVPANFMDRGFGPSIRPDHKPYSSPSTRRLNIHRDIQLTLAPR